mmetsp:Transcript_37724/g.73877  ORF Transcript_37724/g.73877 Transcript_37724/m.73877 type:complete len:94 (+) Transcript_37724:1-282(+)
MVLVKQLVDFAQRKDQIVALPHTVEGWDVKLRNAKKLCAKWIIFVVAQFGIYIARIRQPAYVTFVRGMTILFCIEPAFESLLSVCQIVIYIVS